MLTIAQCQLIYTHEGLESKIVSRARPGLGKLSLHRLYHTAYGRWTLESFDGKRICFASNSSGRQNLWIVDPSGGWPLQLTVSDQLGIPAWSPGRQMDNLPVRLWRQ